MFLLWVSNSCVKIKSFQYFFVEIMDFNPLCDVISPDFVRKIFRILKFLKTMHTGKNFQVFNENRILIAISVQEECLNRDTHTQIHRYIHRHPYNVNILGCEDTLSDDVIITYNVIK